MYFTPQHDVIFRVSNGSGCVIALLPQLPAESIEVEWEEGKDAMDICSGAILYNYEGIPAGETRANPWCCYLTPTLELSRPATPEEYEPLKIWLEKKGLKVNPVTEVTTGHHSLRKRISMFERAHDGCGYNVSLIQLQCGFLGLKPKPFANLYKPNFWHIKGRYRTA